MKFDQLKKIMILSQDKDDCKVSYRLFKILENINKTKDFNDEIRVSIILNGPIKIEHNKCIIQYESPGGKQKLIMSIKYDDIMQIIDSDAVIKIDKKEYYEF